MPTNNKDTGFWKTALDHRTHGSTLLRVRFNNRNRVDGIECVRSTPAKHSEMNRHADGYCVRLTPKQYKNKAEKKAMKRAVTRFNRTMRDIAIAA